MYFCVKFNYAGLMFSTLKRNTWFPPTVTCLSLRNVSLGVGIAVVLWFVQDSLVT